MTNIDIRVYLSNVLTQNGPATRLVCKVQIIFRHPDLAKVRARVTEQASFTLTTIIE